MIKKGHINRLLEDAQRLSLAGALMKDEIDAFVRDMQEILEWNNNNNKEVKDESIRNNQKNSS